MKYLRITLAASALVVAAVLWRATGRLTDASSSSAARSDGTSSSANKVGDDIGSQRVDVESPLPHLVPTPEIAAPRDTTLAAAQHITVHVVDSADSPVPGA